MMFTCDCYAIYCEHNPPPARHRWYRDLIAFFCSIRIRTCIECQRIEELTRKYRA